MTRRQRWRILGGYIVLTFGCSLGIYLAQHAASDNARRVARGVQVVTLSNCQAGNDLRRALHAYVVLALPKTAAYDFARDAADRTFAPRDCVALVHQLKR